MINEPVVPSVPPSFILKILKIDGIKQPQIM